MRNRPGIVILLTAALLGAGCASTAADGPDANSKRASEGSSVEECIRTRAVRAYDALDDQHIWVEENSSRQFLLTLYSRCPDISYAQAIAFTNMMSICPKNPGSVTFRDVNGGLRCDIQLVERVGSKGEAESIVDDRRRFGN